MIDLPVSIPSAPALHASMNDMRVFSARQVSTMHLYLLLDTHGTTQKPATVSIHVTAKSSSPPHPAPVYGRRRRHASDSEVATHSAVAPTLGHAPDGLGEVQLVNGLEGGRDEGLEDGRSVCGRDQWRGGVDSDKLRESSASVGLGRRERGQRGHGAVNVGHGGDWWM